MFQGLIVNMDRLRARSSARIRAGKFEIQHPRNPIARHQDITGIEVAMDDLLWERLIELRKHSQQAADNVAKLLLTYLCSEWTVSCRPSACADRDALVHCL